jgi:hypothetical protein
MMEDKKPFFWGIFDGTKSKENKKSWGMIAGKTFRC